LISYQAKKEHKGRKTLSACMLEFPFYKGDLDVSTSRVVIKFDEEDNMEFKFNLRGAEKECVGCGLHVHSGTSCEDIKDHFYSDGVENPWPTNLYSSNHHGKAKGSNVVSNGNGYGADDNEGHAVVIHGSDGTPYGCGILTKSREAAKSCPKGKEDLETCIQTYPGYEGDLHHVAGKIKTSFKGPRALKRSTHQRFRHNLKNADTDCEDCGIHIHSGNSCEDETAIGGHFYNPSKANPWASVVYNTSSTGEGSGVSWLDNGYDSFHNNGKVVVLHAKDGTRYGCGVLSTKKAKGCLK